MIFSILLSAGISLISNPAPGMTLDIEVEGAGYLIVQTSDGDYQFYKTGDYFVLDEKTNTFVDSRGLNLMGYAIDSETGTMSGMLSPVRLDESQLLFTWLEADGTLYANGCFGDQTAIYKIPLAAFENHRMLTKAGSDLYQQNRCSGIPRIGSANWGGFGGIIDMKQVQKNACTEGLIIDGK